MIASALLKQIPELLLAPADHNAWTNESVQELIALWAETCRLIEQLADRLEQHAVRAVASVFGCHDLSAADSWHRITHWRFNRQVLQSQAASLNSQARTLFLVTQRPSGTIREAILDEFARTTVGINTPYHTWSSLDHLDRLVKEVQKAREEIETRWRAVASAEDVWHDGLATAALGRPMVGVKAEKAAQYLSEWASSIRWPNCAAALRTADLQQLSPGLEAQICADISVILRRIAYQAEDWQRELSDALPKQFGVEGWSQAEVERAVARVGHALKHAANLDTLLRKHTLSKVLNVFVSDASAPLADDLLLTWRAAHPIPAENDLAQDAQLLLAQIDAPTDLETTLLFTLPRALPSVGQSYQQWQAYADLECYVKTVAAAVHAIASYEPLTNCEQQWLTMLAADTLRRPLASPPREKQHLARAVAAQCNGWLRDLRLPTFTSSLTAVDLAELYPDTLPEQINVMLALLKSEAWLGPDPALVLLGELPQMLGVTQSSATWDAEVVDGLLADSPDATLIAELLAAPTDDPLTLLLTTLPSKLSAPKASYGCWLTWGQRFAYLQALELAAAEIAQRGQVSEATPEVHTLWESFKAQVATLSLDEQRWLIKVFREEFRV